ncbi:hypothetical protein JJJ17_09395 [Paracoccus caeni]|uniref:Uncharacterized protein n=1 Tax=Paracoccus caeni TaxID=657651 RepID=A0A934SJ86_9RHOB|nr:hypothetical protein [Paracoccus caeni]MBK4216139.1 hypothetical protein [Paracoccus caeni]
MKTRVLDIGNIALPGTGYPPLAAFKIPFRPQLAGAFFLGSGREVGLTDWSGKTSGAVAVGSPLWEEGYAELSGANYLQTGVPETTFMTLVACVRSLTNSESAFIGGWGGPGNAGVALVRFATNDRIAGLAGLSNDTHQTVNANGPIMNQWAICSLKVGGSNIWIENHSSGQTSGVIDYPAGLSRKISANAHPLRLGRGYTPSYVNPVQINSALMYNASLTITDTREAAHLVHGYAQRSLGIDIPFVT